MESGSGSRPQHIDSFDGIRGLAVLLVLVDHAGWFADGWVGVDLFFVLSGFLITGILRRSREQAFYWRRFYIHRATRILPPLLLAIAAAALFWPHTSPIGIAGYLLSLGNVVDMTRFFIWPLEHLWSLSVEEHFYLVWPLAILWLRRRQLTRLLVAVVIVVPLGRLLFTYLLPRHAPNVIYFLTPFRIDGLALGCLLSLLLEERDWQQRLQQWSLWGAAVAGGVYLLLWTVLGHAHFYPFAYSAAFNGIGYSLVAVTAFFVVAHARLCREGAMIRVLCFRPLRGLGVISYGVYVYSWVLLQLGWRAFPHASSLWMGLGSIVVSIAVAAVLFTYYERPISRWGKTVGRSWEQRREQLLQAERA